MYKGSLTGAILLIAGCCIGAGMLGIPVISALSGFIPSTLMLTLSWLFMSTTALLLLEINLSFKEEVSLISMAGKTLGAFGQAIAWVCFLFVFYCLGVAYISGSGELLAGFYFSLTGLPLANWIGYLAISLTFALFVYLGTRAVDLFNRLLMLGLIVSYVLLVVFGAPFVHKEHLTHIDFSQALPVLPIMIISFGFHNLIPTLVTYLDRDVKRLRTAILIGSFIPLCVYLVWEWIILGLLPLYGDFGLKSLIDQGAMASQLLQHAVGSSSSLGHFVVLLTECFAFFAILTSFLGNSLSFVDFLADGLRIPKNAMGTWLLCFLVIAPPLVMAILYPHLFLTALSFAGAFGAVILFGVLPALMVWSGRYRHHLQSYYRVAGGKALLIVIIAFSLSIVALNLHLLV